MSLTIVAFGDSITAAVEVAEPMRWPALLEGRLAPHQATVVNCGVGGSTAREGLARIADVMAQRPQIVLVEFGGNDAVVDPHRHVPLTEYLDHLDAMRRRFQEELGATVVMLTFPPIVNDWSSDNFQHLEYGGVDEHVELYRQATRQYAAEHGLAVADLDLALREAALQDGWGHHFQADGVHLTAEGNRVVGETVFLKVEEIVNE